MKGDIVKTSTHKNRIAYKVEMTNDSKTFDCGVWNTLEIAQFVKKQLADNPKNNNLKVSIRKITLN